MLLYRAVLFFVSVSSKFVRAELQGELGQHVRRPPDRIVVNFNECIDDLALKNSYVKGHALRYKQTFAFLIKGYWRAFNNTNDQNVMQILDLGGSDQQTGLENAFPDCLAKVWRPYKAVNITVYSEDLRRTFDKVPDVTFDLVLCLEVIEHVADLTPMELGAPVEGLMFPKAFWKSGMKTLLSEVHRVLRRRGRLLLTTPNAGSLRSIVRAIKHKAGMFDNYHVRELSTDELGRLLMSSGSKPQSSGEYRRYCRTPFSVISQYGHSADQWTLWSSTNKCRGRLSRGMLVQDGEPWPTGRDTVLEGLLMSYMEHIRYATGGDRQSCLDDLAGYEFDGAHWTVASVEGAGRLSRVLADGARALPNATIQERDVVVDRLTQSVHQSILTHSCKIGNRGFESHAHGSEVPVLISM